MTQRKTPDPTPLEADYYPRIKIHGRWFLIVPEIDDGGSDDKTAHDGCAFFRPEKYNADLPDFSHCSLHCAEADGVPTFDRHDCGDNGTIFVAPSKFPEYRAHLVADKLEGKP